MTNLKLSDFKKIKGIHLKWKFAEILEINETEINFKIINKFNKKFFKISQFSKYKSNTN